MTDTQILTLIIGITFPVLGVIGAIAAMIAGNKRMDDLRITLTGSMDALKADLKGSQAELTTDLKKAQAELRADLKSNMAELKTDLNKSLGEKLDNGFEHMTLLLKLHEAEHHKP